MTTPSDTYGLGYGNCCSGTTQADIPSINLSPFTHAQKLQWLNVQNTKKMKALRAMSGNAQMPVKNPMTPPPERGVGVL